MLEEKKENILEDNYYLKKRKKARLKTRFLAIKNRLFILGIVFGILITAVLYLMLPSSEVFKVVVKGNEYLKDDYYINLSKIKDGDKFLLVNLNKVKNQISSSSIVDSVTVKRNNYNLIEINVKEKEIIGYTYEVEPKILLSDGSTINLENDYLNVIASVPLIEGYDEEGLKLIAIGFKKLDQKMIDEISDFQVIRAKILSPLRNTMRFINHHHGYFNRFTQSQKSLCVQPFGRNIYNLVRAFLRTGQCK